MTTNPEMKPTSAKQKPINEPYEMTAVTSDTSIKHHGGFVLGILITALFVIIIGLFFWYKASQLTPTSIAPSSRPSAAENNEPESTTAEAQTESFTVLSTSDEITAIEADLASTNLDSLGSDLNQIDAVLDASIQR